MVDAVNQRTDTNVSHSAGRRGRRTVEEKHHRTVVEDIDEAEHFAFQRVEVSHYDAWVRGANLGAVAVLGGIVAILAGWWVVPATLVGWTGAIAILALVFVVGTALPPALISAYGFYLDSVALKAQRATFVATVLNAERAQLKAAFDRDTTVIDGEVKVLQSEQRSNNLALAQKVRQENDLAVFAASVFERGEPLSHRHWERRQMPSGRAVTFKRWQSEFIEPLVAVGAVEPPAVRGKTYSKNKLPFVVVEDKLRRAGFLNQ
jgi:hypothetical protein